MVPTMIEHEGRTPMIRATSRCTMLFSLLLCLAARSAWAQSDVCTAEANNPRFTIQNAIDRNCTHIRLTPGTYHENVRVLYGQQVSITSVQGAAKTIVDGGGNGAVFSTNDGAELTLTGITIQNGISPGYGGGISNTFSLV